ncbi:retinoblastoma-associated protein-like [Physella acuta]|uniref:retinoblastoma-associated protein-like n=1 Tax=Physella acuta TaxID=109671 RepID=UPI0027DC429A|nr:retinoblastoma-associated protein-like [Physella acuta]
MNLDDDGKESQNKIHSEFARSQSKNSMQELLYQASLQKYDEFCHEISITNDIKQRGNHIVQELLRLGIFDSEPQIEEKSLFASIIYMAVVESRLPYGPMDPLLEHRSFEPSITVTDILQKANVNINTLFKTMDVIKRKMVVTKSVEENLMKLERNYLVVSALFHTFQGRLCTSVFREDSIRGGLEETSLPPIPVTEGVPFRKKQCWVLYLLAKEHLLPTTQELFQHFQLLLCCLEFVLRQTPSFLLNSPYDAIKFSYSPQEQGVTMLKKLAEEFDVTVKETVQLHLETTEPFFQNLLNEDGELESDRLREKYENALQKEGDVNELDFLKGESYLRPLQVNKQETQEQKHSRLSPELMTPVRLAVSTIQNFQQNFADLSDVPSDRLKQFFKRCTVDPSDEVNRIMANLKVTFVKGYSAVCPSADSKTTLAEYRFSLGAKLYLKVLETILLTESDHLAANVLSTLLNKESFHKSLLACALEVVLATYSQTWAQVGETAFSFPWILEIFSLQAYEFYKVVESFIKAEPKLPVDVVKHLHNNEIRILESLAWNEKSILFDAFGCDWDHGQRTPPSVSPVKTSDLSSHPQTLPLPNKSAVDLFLSPGRPSSSNSTGSTPPPHTESSHYHTLPSKLNTQPKSQSLAHFLKRVLRLGFTRQTKLCTDLRIASDLQHKIWTCFEHCVTKMPELLKNRHIDQIIMCCIYGICKVAEHEIKFKSIVSEYKNMPHARPEVFKDVYISPDQTESIINFYNSVFVQTIKMYILQFSPNRESRPQLSPMPKQSPSYVIPGKKNFLISPLKESVFKTPSSPSQMTPSTRLLYSFGDTIGSSEKLKDINERVKKGFPGASAKKRLNMDEVSPSSKAKKSLLQ